MKYKVIALIGKAGSGKDFTMKKVLSKKPLELNEIVSCTTRPKREGEIDGVNYHFITPEAFSQRLLGGLMLEATLFNDWAYGTSWDALRINDINIGVFNPAGIDALLENKNIDLKVFYIYADDKVRLMRQLNREKDPDCKEIVRRFQTDEKDFAFLDFDYTLLSNNGFKDLQRNVDIILGAFD